MPWKRILVVTNLLQSTELYERKYTLTNYPMAVCRSVDINIIFIESATILYTLPILSEFPFLLIVGFLPNQFHVINTLLDIIFVNFVYIGGLLHSIRFTDIVHRLLYHFSNYNYRVVVKHQYHGHHHGRTLLVS